MEIMASMVRKNDYVFDFGVVTDVRKFYQQRSIKTKINPMNICRENFSENKDYARLVAKQQEDSYEDVLDRVVLISDGKTKTFPADKLVKVYRVGKEVA